MSSFFPQFADSFSALLDDMKSRRVAVIGHARPDGDCIGSQLAMTGLLRESGVDAIAVNADEVPRALNFLADSQLSVNGIEAILNDERSLVYVDCADEFRVGPKTACKLENRDRLANIDHHISNTNYARNNIVDAESAATCEIIAGLAYDFDMPISKQVAQSLYVGIMTDTGQFGFAATSSRVFELCGLLVRDGASPHDAYKELFDKESINRLKLLQRYLASLKLELGNRVCVGELRQKDFLETGTDHEDTERFVDYARSVAVSDVGMLIEERKKTSKCSLRASDSAIRLDQIAAQFGGGGHSCAAAMNTEISIDELREGLLKALEKRFSEIDS